MGLVCFDTHMIIWGVQGLNAKPGREEERIEKAKYLISTCEENDVKIMVPSIVLSEVLCALHMNHHVKVAELMHRRFIVSPFDVQSAIQFARIWSNKKKITEISRHEMKADYMIIATALARKAECIYSEDKGLKNFAQDYIEIKSLPDLPNVQMKLL
jgi:predicted nucleic acid-binding protein